MKNNILAFLATFITFWLIGTSNDLSDAQTVNFASSHLFAWQTSINIDLNLLLIINILCLPVFIFFLKYLWGKLEKKLKKIDLNLFFIGSFAGIISGLPNAGWALFITLLIYLVIMLTFNNDLEDAATAIKFAISFYFATVTFFALSEMGIILTLTISIFVGALVATIYEIIKKYFEIVYIFTLIFLLIIIDRPSYHN